MTSDDPGIGPGGAVPDLNAQTVIGIFERAEQAEAAAQALRDAGFSENDISLIMRPAQAPRRSSDETKTASGTVAGGVIGAVIGGGAMALASVVLPGIGTLLVGGPVGAAIAGALGGGAFGGLAGSFAGLGIPTDHARRFEEAVRSGGVLLAVKVDGPNAVESATEIMTRHGAPETTSFVRSL